MDLGRPEGLPFPGGFTLSFLPYGFPTLAIIVALTTYLQTKLTLPPSTQSQRSGRGDEQHDDYLYAIVPWLAGA